MGDKSKIRWTDARRSERARGRHLGKRQHFDQRFMRLLPSLIQPLGQILRALPTVAGDAAWHDVPWRTLTSHAYRNDMVPGGGLSRAVGASSIKEFEAGLLAMRRDRIDLPLASVDALPAISPNPRIGRVTAAVSLIRMETAHAVVNLFGRKPSLAATAPFETQGSLRTALRNAWARPGARVLTLFTGHRSTAQARPVDIKGGQRLPGLALGAPLLSGHYAGVVLLNGDAPPSGRLLDCSLCSLRHTPLRVSSVHSILLHLEMGQELDGQRWEMFPGDAFPVRSEAAS